MLAGSVRLLERYAGRIGLQREIAESIIYQPISKALLAHPAAARGGFIRCRQGLQSLKVLARKYLNVTAAELGAGDDRRNADRTSGHFCQVGRLVGLADLTGRRSTWAEGR